MNPPTSIIVFMIAAAIFMSIIKWLMDGPAAATFTAAWTSAAILMLYLLVKWSTPT